MISISVKRSNFILPFSEAAYHANPGAEKKFAASSSHISQGPHISNFTHFQGHIFIKFSNTSANNNEHKSNLNSFEHTIKF